MRAVLSELVELLTLERIEAHLFRGQSQDLGWGSVFGGQVLGQALSAARQTVPEDRCVHSLHGYFLRRGDCSRPIVYDVDSIRDGRSFTTRRVVAIQNGKAIFNMSTSFQVAEEGFDHQDEMPETTEPEALLSEREILKKYVDKVPPPLRVRAMAERPIECRPVERLLDPTAPKVRGPKRQVWYRTPDKLPEELDFVHQCLLAYASDFNFLTTAMQPHGVSWLSPNMQVASIDHAMWFHRPLRMDEWLLHVIESPSASGARGLARGRFFDQSGRLVASTAQEGLMRQR